VCEKSSIFYSQITHTQFFLFLTKAFHTNMTDHILYKDSVHLALHKHTLKCSVPS